MRRRSIVLLVSVVALVAAAAAGLYWFQVQRAPPLPPYTPTTNGELEVARIDSAVQDPNRILESTLKECLAWRGHSPIMTGVQT